MTAIERYEGIKEEHVSERLILAKKSFRDAEELRRLKPYGFFHAMYTVTMVRVLMNRGTGINSGPLSLIDGPLIEYLG